MFYNDFSVDYYFLDTTVFDTYDPHADQGHNVCSMDHNPDPASCGATGPQNIWECPTWFAKLWADQTVWVEKHLRESTADWQIVVTHFPPSWGQEYWFNLTTLYGIDLIVTGHIHSQAIWEPSNEFNPLKPTGVIISGGGGGITSEGPPEGAGFDDQYGFMDLTLSKNEIKIEAISHGGVLRRTTLVHQRQPGPLPTVPPPASVPADLDSIDAMTEDAPATPSMRALQGAEQHLPGPQPKLAGGVGDAQLRKLPEGGFQSLTGHVAEQAKPYADGRLICSDSEAVACLVGSGVGAGGYRCRAGLHGLCRHRGGGPFPAAACTEQCLIDSEKGALAQGALPNEVPIVV